jgi:hypothetical protein
MPRLPPSETPSSREQALAAGGASMAAPIQAVLRVAIMRFSGRKADQV